MQGREAKMEDEGKDWTVTLKTGAQVNAELAVAILEELRSLKRAHKHEFDVLYELFERGYSSDPEVIAEHQKAGLLLDKNGDLKPEAEKIFKAALGNSRGQVVEDPFRRVQPAEQEILKRLEAKLAELPVRAMSAAFTPKKLQGTMMRQLRDRKRGDGIDPSDR
jgi:hypothetical protein